MNLRLLPISTFKNFLTRTVLTTFKHAPSLKSWRSTQDLQDYIYNFHHQCHEQPSLDATVHHTIKVKGRAYPLGHLSYVKQYSLLEHAHNANMHPLSNFKDKPLSYGVNQHMHVNTPYLGKQKLKDCSSHHARFLKSKTQQAHSAHTKQQIRTYFAHELLMGQSFHLI